MGIVVGADAEQAQYSNCATDVMTVTNQQTLPNVCGTLTGEHGTLILIFELKSVGFNMFFLFSAYFEASDLCHTLSFTFGQTARGSTIPTTRKFSIKVHKLVSNSTLYSNLGYLLVF